MKNRCGGPTDQDHASHIVKPRCPTAIQKSCTHLEIEIVSTESVREIAVEVPNDLPAVSLEIPLATSPDTSIGMNFNPWKLFLLRIRLTQNEAEAEVLMF